MNDIQVTTDEFRTWKLAMNDNRFYAGRRRSGMSLLPEASSKVIGRHFYSPGKGHPRATFWRRILRRFLACL